MSNITLTAGQFEALLNQARGKTNTKSIKELTENAPVFKEWLYYGFELLPVNNILIYGDISKYYVDCIIYNLEKFSNEYHRPLICINHRLQIFTYKDYDEWKKDNHFIPELFGFMFKKICYELTSEKYRVTEQDYESDNDDDDNDDSSINSSSKKNYVAPKPKTTADERNHILKLVMCSDKIPNAKMFKKIASGLAKQMKSDHETNWVE